jgi:hypothetical protein
MILKQLLGDLAVAERNIKDRIKYFRISFDEEVRKAFIENKVESYFDLIRADYGKAIELRELAVREKLI